MSQLLSASPGAVLSKSELKAVPHGSFTRLMGDHSIRELHARRVSRIWLGQ